MSEPAQEALSATIGAPMAVLTALKLERESVMERVGQIHARIGIEWAGRDISELDRSLTVQTVAFLYTTLKAQSKAQKLAIASLKVSGRTVRAHVEIDDDLLQDAALDASVIPEHVVDQAGRTFVVEELTNAFPQYESCLRHLNLLDKVSTYAHRLYSPIGADAQPS